MGVPLTILLVIGKLLKISNKASTRKKANEIDHAEHSKSNCCQRQRERLLQR